MVGETRQDEAISPVIIKCNSEPLQRREKIDLKFPEVRGSSDPATDPAEAIKAEDGQEIIQSCSSFTKFAVRTKWMLEQGMAHGPFHEVQRLREALNKKNEELLKSVEA